MSKTYYVYIVTNQYHNVLYTGVTSNLHQRIWQHKNKIFKGFSSKYNADKLVYYEVFEDILFAIDREKQLKGGSRRKKLDLIQLNNPGWADLSLDLR